ncbi:MAG: hypothetical protein OXE53_18495 [Deltaproteobacteria bacterium]|nr:hypothetical protein [Deltaproteobacteria bacterium]
MDIDRRYSKKVIFLSHKTGDESATALASRIDQHHNATVYMAEWDDRIDASDPNVLPDYIMAVIQTCDGFLVNVSSPIIVSMWVGYEIGGAHALRKTRAKYIYSYVPNLPSVVEALKSINGSSLDSWIRSL